VFVRRRATRAAKAVLVCALVVSSMPAALARPAQQSCDAHGPTAGGDWPVYGGDAYNSRSQPAESTIGAANAGSLQAAWTFAGASVGGGGGVNGTPVEADGCVFIGTTTGYVYAVDVTTGHAAWSRQLGAPNPGTGGAIVGSPVVSGRTAYVLVNQQVEASAPTGVPNGPYVAALDIGDGSLRWTSPPIADAVGDYSNASPVVMPTPDHGRVVFAGFSPQEGEATGQGGFALVSADDGSLLVRTYTVPPDRQQRGYAGGGIWSTPAFDPATGYAYVGAGNPNSKQIEDPNTDAILKISLADPQFGQIVGEYHGNPDQYTQTLETVRQSPLCAVSAGAPDPFDDPACGQLDLDFGAAPNLFRIGGQLMVGDLQKAGLYDVADATTMTGRWATVVGAPCQFCNAASAAVAGGRVYGVGSPGGLTYALAGADGSRAWSSVTPDVTHYESTSVANGVVYTYDNQGVIHAFDASSGSPVWVHPMAADVHSSALALTSAGIAVAAHTVLVAVTAGPASFATIGASVPNSLADTYLIAYRLPG